MYFKCIRKKLGCREAAMKSLYLDQEGVSIRSITILTVSYVSWLQKFAIEKHLQLCFVTYVNT